MLQTRAIWRSNKWLFLTALPFKLVNDASQFIGPVFLSLLLGVVSKGQPSSLGYTYAVLMLLGLILGTLTDNQQFQRVMRAGIQTSRHACSTADLPALGMISQCVRLEACSDGNPVAWLKQGESRMRS